MSNDAVTLESVCESGMTFTHNGVRHAVEYGQLRSFFAQRPEVIDVVTEEDGCLDVQGFLAINEPA